jgi:hypothetical protein
MNFRLIWYAALELGRTPDDAMQGLWRHFPNHISAHTALHVLQRC